MNKINKIVLITVAATFIIGFFAGYFYKGYEIKRNFEKLAEGIGGIFSQGINSGNNSSKFNNKVNSETQKAEVANKKEIEDYIPNIEITVEVSEYESILNSENRFNGKNRSLEGKIKNIGDKSIKDLTLLVKFLDKNGRPIYENDYNPLYNSNKMGSVVLKPNYSNEFGFNTDGVPVEWSGKIEYQISDLSFEKIGD